MEKKHGGKWILKQRIIIYIYRQTIGNINFKYYDEIIDDKNVKPTDVVLMVSSKALSIELCDDIPKCNGIAYAIEKSEYNSKLSDLQCSIEIVEIDKIKYNEYTCQIQFPIGIIARSVRLQHKIDGRITINSVSISRLPTQPQVKYITINLPSTEGQSEEEIKESLMKAISELLDENDLPNETIENIKKKVQEVSGVDISNIIDEKKNENNKENKKSEIIQEKTESKNNKENENNKKKNDNDNTQDIEVEEKYIP